MEPILYDMDRASPLLLRSIIHPRPVGILHFNNHPKPFTQQSGPYSPFWPIDLSKVFRLAEKGERRQE